MSSTRDRWLDSRTFRDCGKFAGRRKKKRLVSSVVPEPIGQASKGKAEEEIPAKDPEPKPAAKSDESPFKSSEEVIEEAPPSVEEMAAFLGEPEDPLRDEDTVVSDDRPIPSLEEADKRISPKTKALMEELFRAKLDKVQRINTKKIR